MSRSPDAPAVFLRSIGTAVPRFRISQTDALAVMEERFAASLSAKALATLRQVFLHPGVAHRHLAIDTPEQLFAEDPDGRNARFTREARRLAARALDEALERAGLGAQDLSALLVNTCTGYLCPGLSNYLLEDLELPRDLYTADLLGAGCGAALPSLELARRWVAAEGRPAACVAVEVCSATFRMGEDNSLLVSNALFGDGAAAFVLAPDGPGLRLGAAGRSHHPEHREHVRYIYRDGQLQNQITPRLPLLSARAAREAVAATLAGAGREAASIPHWAVHPGGSRVVDAIERTLDLEPAQLEPARRVLRDRGNLSSATVGFVLREIWDAGLAPDDRVMALSFGAGLSAHALLLSATG